MSLGAFGKKLFEVNENKILIPDGISVGESLNVEMQETEGGKPATYIKGFNAMEISFNIALNYAFCDVKAEIEWWLLKMRSQTPEYLTLGNKTYGTNKMLLNDVQVGDLLLAPNGLHLKANLSLKFSEWTKKGYKKDNDSDNATTKTKTVVSTTTNAKGVTTTKKTTTTTNGNTVTKDTVITKN